MHHNDSIIIQSLNFGAFGLYRLDMLASMMISRVARVGVEATLSSYTETLCEEAMTHAPQQSPPMRFLRRPSTLEGCNH